MKKLIAFILCAVTVVFLAGCIKNEPVEKTPEEKTEIGGEPVSFDDTDEYLVENGNSKYKIAIGEDATKTEKYVAEELQYFIEKSTAVKLPIVTDEEVSHDNNARYLSVGENKLLAAETDIEINYDELGQNGVTVNTKGNCVYMAGATETGTLFSVYRFLHYQVGYNAYAYDCVEVDYYHSCKLKNFDYKYVPSLGLTTAEDAELSGEGKVKEAFRMYVYASKNGGYDMNGNLYNGLWCHTMPYIVTQTLDQPRIEAAEKAEKEAKLGQIKDLLCETYGYEQTENGALVPGENADETGYVDFMRGFDKACETLFSSIKSVKDDIDSEVLGLYRYELDRKGNIVPQYVRKTEKNDKGEDVPVIKDGNYVYETDGKGNPLLKTDGDGNPFSDVTGFENYEKGWNAAYENGTYHVGSVWQKNVKSIRLWNNKQVCYSKPEAVELAAETLTSKYINVANGPYLMLGVTDGVGACDCDECKAAELNDGETCDKNAIIAEEMKGWAAITDNLMMYSYGTNFQAYKYHFNNWSHIGDSIRFYEKCGLKYYFEQACAQNGVSPMSSMRAYVRSRLAWNAAYDTQDLIDEFIEHYYGEGAESVKQYFSAVMENFERIYTLAETEEQDIYYSAIMSNDNWTRSLLLELESYLEKAFYTIDLGYSENKEIYKERIFREYFLLKDNEYMKYSSYLNQEEYDRLEELVMYGREKYNAYNSTEKTNNG